MSVTMTLEDEFDISRGDIIAKPGNQPEARQDIEMMMCWMSQRPLNINSKYVVKHTTKEVKGIIKQIQYKLDINSLQRIPDADQLSMNEIGKVQLRVSQPLFPDIYRRNRITGSVILIEEGTNETVGAGMIV